MKIGLDIMGGDFAPRSAILGAIAAQALLPSGEEIVLIGDKEQATPIFADQGYDLNKFEFVHTNEVIGMAEHPTKAIMQKPQSSIALGFRLLKEGKIDSFSSAGNTGAMLVGAMFSVKPIAGVWRPAIAALIPKVKGNYGVMLDAGANADCKAEMLLQFGILGSIYIESIYGVTSPKVGLINIGEEEEKGNLLVQSAYHMMKNTKAINFIGNIEGRDMFNEKADVIVCDGFTGNVVLKLAETFYDFLLKKEPEDAFIKRLDYEQYGGSPILGLRAPVTIGHGISSPEAIKNMVLLSKTMIKSKLADKISLAFE